LSGDQALQVVASSVQKHVRKNDILARLGGDEFALLLPHTNQDSARSALQKIQNELLKEMQRNNWPITFSIGVLTCRFAPSSTDELIKIVDELMYLVKREGKNSIIYSTYDGSYPVPQHRK
jgi:diguanylate cyclase (GGDEF)-like protein